MRLRLFAVFAWLMISTSIISFLPSASASFLMRPLQDSLLAPSPASRQVQLRSAEETGALMFIENMGQFGVGARFKALGARISLYVADDALWFMFLEEEPQARRRDRSESQNQIAGPHSSRGVHIKLSFIGANPQAHIESFGPLKSHISYLRGNDPSQWHSNVPVWSGVRYVNLYPGIDLELTSRQQQLEQRLIVRPGADLSAVRLQVRGADNLALKDNHIQLTTSVGDFTIPLLQVLTDDGTLLPLPHAVPEIHDNAIHAPFARLLSLQTTPSSQSTADLRYSTFLGASGADITVDSSGAAYITGGTVPAAFPATPGAFDTSFNGGLDAIVAKLNPDGSTLDYATFLGGGGYDTGKGITVDTTGAAYVTGFTYSVDFPTTPGALDTSYNGTDTNDVFLVKLAPDGTKLAYATYLGAQSAGSSVALDTAGNAYIAGYTADPHFPTTPGAFDSTCGTDGTCNDTGTYTEPDAFVAKLSSDGATLLYATYLGGNDNDIGNDIVIDSDGFAYVTGTTRSGDFPSTASAFDPSYNGGIDAFLVKLNPNGSAPTYATFLGGGDMECAGTCSIALDQYGSAYVMGGTRSFNFPTTPGAFDTSYNGGTGDIFVAKLNPSGSALDYGTFIGGRSDDCLYVGGCAITVDSNGAAYVTGDTASADFPTAPGAFDFSYQGDTDIFVAELNPSGSQLTYSTFIGGKAFEYGYGIAVDGRGDIYVVGVTISSNFPTTPVAFDSTFDIGYNGFILKLAPKDFHLYLPITLYACDTYEPNDSRSVNPWGPIVSRQFYGASFCRGDKEDNYYLDTTTSKNVSIALSIPPSLTNRLIVWLYAAKNLALPIPGCGGGLGNSGVYATVCHISEPGRYIVRLYTDGPVDDINPYTLQVTYS
jgi:Beta-propeller repeat